MPLYIPWLTETIKKRGVRYLLHHYLGQFFEEKLTLEQLSIDIYEGKGSIRNLFLDVNGLNDELDFIPFKFLDGCLIGQISVEVPWSSLATEACRVELEGAKFVCRLKTSADGSKAHCIESTLLTRSLMTSSMQMAEDIVTTEDDEDYESPNSSVYNQQSSGQESPSMRKKKDANQMFEGLEMFAQLIDSVLRRTKLTARNTLFQIQPHPDGQRKAESDEDDKIDSESASDETPLSNPRSYTSSAADNKSTSGDEFGEPGDGGMESNNEPTKGEAEDASQNTVEFLIKFFRCEEIIDQSWDNQADQKNSDPSRHLKQPSGSMPETITKLLTLEDVEMRIGGIPVSNLIGKHTIMIKFNGQKSEISIFSGSPLLAVIGHEQLKTFFNVFENAKERDNESSPPCEKNQKVMSPEDYAKIENQLLESASLKVGHHHNHHHHQQHDLGGSSNHVSSHSGRRWVDTGDLFSNLTSRQHRDNMDYDYHSPNSSSTATCLDGKVSETEPSLENIEAFSCELKLPGIWLCILRDGEELPPLIKPYADSMNSFQTINKYIDTHIKVPHIRLLALKVALDMTTAGINIFLGDLDISEHLQDNSMSPTLHLLHNDLSNCPMNSSRYKAFIMNNKEITVDILTKTRVLFDPTMIDRIVYDYKLFKLDRAKSARNSGDGTGSRKIVANHQLDLNLTIRGEQFKVELLCPIPDLTPEASLKKTQLRPQSFLFDFKNIVLTWQSGKLKISAQELLAYVKTQPKQSDNESIKFIEAASKNNDKILLTLEPTPSNLDTAFPNDIEQALNESSMYDSIYIGQATESRLPTEAFQTKRKVVRACGQSQQPGGKSHKADGGSSKINECDNEKIIAPGDRQHLTDYLNQTVMCTKMSLSLHLPICEVEFEDKEQLDLIYNRFANDFVFWQPRAFNPATSDQQAPPGGCGGGGRGNLRHPDDMARRKSHRHESPLEEDPKNLLYKQPLEDDRYSSEGDCSDQESEVSFHSLSVEGVSSSEFYDNQLTCRVVVDELSIRFNHQSCAAALQQEINLDNLLLGAVIDVNRKPGTVLSLVADNLELSSDSDVVLQGNCFGDKSSIFSLTAEIKRPTKSLKDIKLAIQLVNGLFNDFKTDTYTRFWQSINVTDEPVLGFVAPKIVTELHIDILNTALSIARDGLRPALLSIDELYLTSMVMEQTSQVMIRMIADEVSLYLKRNKQGLETMKNYICLIDSGLIDLDVKLSKDGRLEFGVINNVITVRACQDSLSALCKLFSVMVKNNKPATTTTNETTNDHQASSPQQPSTTTTGASNLSRRNSTDDRASSDISKSNRMTTTDKNDHVDDDGENSDGGSGHNSTARTHTNEREMDLLEDAMNDFSVKCSKKPHGRNSHPSVVAGKDILAEFEQELSDYDDDDDDNDEQSNSGRLGAGKEEVDQDDNDNSGDDDDDGPPATQQTVRNPNACLLDESNPVVGDFLSQPLLPAASPSSPSGASSSASSSSSSSSCLSATEREMNESSDTFNTATHHRKHQRATTTTVDESGFFVIGDDDVGAGIIDKLQREPVVRKLIEGPINIIENHFKMTKPRTIPEMLASSLERYVLEEMTLVVNLYGGRDFDDEPSGSSGEVDTNSTTTTTTNPNSVTDDGAELLDVASMDGVSMRSRAGSLASTTSSRAQYNNRSPLNRKHCSSDSTSGSLGARRRAGAGGSRRKHLSEGSRDLYGGAAGSGQRSAVEQRVRFGEGAVNLWESLDLMSSPDFLGSKRPNQPPLSSDLKLAGGTWRQTDVCIQLTLSKVKLLYELADETSPISWRFMLFIHDIEIKDRIHASDINKMLYEYCTESMPKRNTQILTIKNVATINPTDGCEECDLRVSLKPLRLNIDQDTLLFLIDFFTSFTKSLARQQAAAPAAAASAATAPSPFSPSGSSGYETNSTFGSRGSLGRRTADGSPAASATPSRGGPDVGAPAVGRKQKAAQDRQQAAVSGARRRRHPSERGGSLSLGANSSSSLSSSSSSSSPPSAANHHHQQQLSAASSRHQTQSSSSSSASLSTAAASAATTTTTTSPTESLPTHCHTDNLTGPAANQQRPIYIKTFTFSPDVPIRLDYHSKHLDFEQGALAGILMGLAHLDHSELILRRVEAKRGMRGLDRVLLFTLNSWMSDIKRNQLPSILGGVGPMHSVIQLFQGMRDLIWMPIDHYRKDRRLVRGLQRGASSFSSSTAMAAINLMNRFISIVQCTAQIAHDIVTPPSMQGRRGGGGGGGSDVPCKQAGCSLSSHHSDHHHSSHHHHHLGGSRSHRRLRRIGGGGAGGDGAGSGSGRGSGHHHHLILSSANSSSSAGSIGTLNQPRNFCEGVAVGFTILKEGFNDTARNVAVGMQAEDVRSAMGELVRQIPSTLLNPIISATEGAQNVLVGIRNQIAPDARRDDQEKWKGRVRGK